MMTSLHLNTLLDFCREGVELGEVSELSPVREVQEEVGQVGAAVGELLHVQCTGAYLYSKSTYVQYNCKV